MKRFLHIEAFFIFLAAIWINVQFDGNWWWFAFFAALPDVALFAYLGDPKGKGWPSIVYNVFHIYAVPIVIWIALWEQAPVYLSGWIAHIAIDRVVGYGLKSSVDFKITHLQKAAE